MVVDEAVQVSVESSIQQGQLALGRVEAISLHHSLNVLFCQPALFKSVYTGKSVMYIEGMSPCKSLFTKFDSLLRLEMLSKNSIELSSGCFGEVV